MRKRIYSKRTNREGKNQKLYVNSTRFIAQSHDLSNFKWYTDTKRLCLLLFYI